MKIQHKITWTSSLLFGGIFAIISILIYTSFIQSSERIFYKDLSRTAQISGMFYLEKDELNKANFSPIQNAFYQLNPERKISIYDQNTTTVFNTEDQIDVNKAILNKIRNENIYNFQIDDVFYHGLFYKDNQGDFVVLVSSKNQLIEEQKKSLLTILLVTFIFGMFILILFTSQLAKYAYKPVRNIIKQVDLLDLNTSELLLSYPKTKDELEELFEAFNNLLNEIKYSYQQQKNFVDHASHELKTPLASIINNLEVTLQRPRTTTEYQENNVTVLQAAHRLEQILKNLLLLSGIQRTIQDKTTTRIDEIIWEIINDLQQKYPDRFQIDLQIPPEKTTILTAKVNQTMVYMALFNLMENAAKFSQNPVKITLKESQEKLQISIQDEGIGIPPQELAFLKQPFYRSTNAGTFEGNGLGFSIAAIILEAHHIQMHLQSQLNTGTTITVTIP
ncbi:Signal transduction histidine kinase [Pustulibacterium marinum]|uniref:histidine kinase n=1 Tax=Pustulibacterium marinum TaxID=1224947 RepID=A0A1I7IR27_9FLAO|nr:HAMP domain-containing sensor histidine kinase [Pustulibacterium marinum]SFU75390.1 Signal transduction histidine kinase [Pustulibacterium marinum]